MCLDLLPLKLPGVFEHNIICHKCHYPHFFAVHAKKNLLVQLCRVNYIVYCKELPGNCCTLEDLLGEPATFVGKTKDQA